MLGVAHAQPLLVNQHGLVTQPFLPAGSRDILLNALAQLTRQRRRSQSWQGLSQHDTIDSFRQFKRLRSVDAFRPDAAGKSDSAMASMAIAADSATPSVRDFTLLVAGGVCKSAASPAEQGLAACLYRNLNAANRGGTLIIAAPKS